MLDKEKEIRIGKYKVLLTHGHYYYVSAGLDTLRKEAYSRGLDLVMFGHTHRPLSEYDKELTGINPGSGVGNHRHALDEKSLGVPVISIGVPTVVDAATIVNDTMYNLVTALTQSQAFAAMGNSLEKLNDAEKYELIRELLSPNLNAMFVTPKDIDLSLIHI